jgi:hypothetical protein
MLKSFCHPMLYVVSMWLFLELELNSAHKVFFWAKEGPIIWLLRILYELTLYVFLMWKALSPQDSNQVHNTSFSINDCLLDTFNIFSLSLSLTYCNTSKVYQFHYDFLLNIRIQKWSQIKWTIYLYTSNDQELYILAT